MYNQQISTVGAITWYHETRYKYMRGSEGNLLTSSHVMLNKSNTMTWKQKKMNLVAMHLTKCENK